MSTDLEFEKAKLNQKNVIVAYLLWWFLGWLGVHRAYTNQSKWWLYPLGMFLGAFTAVFLVGYIILIGLFIWWIMDGISLHKIVQTFNLNILEHYEKNQNKAD